MTVRTKERKQFLADVFTTALEGGIGYWSQASEYHWRKPDATDETPFDESQDLDGFYATIHELDDTESGYRATGLRVDIDVIVRGINRIIKAKAPYYDPNGTGSQCADVKFLYRGVAEIVRQASHENDAGEIDAGVADDIVQVGLFGEVRYG